MNAKLTPAAIRMGVILIVSKIQSKYFENFVILDL